MDWNNPFTTKHIAEAEAQGRATSSMNALKHGTRAAEVRGVEAAIAQLARFEREAREMIG